MHPRGDARHRGSGTPGSGDTGVGAGGRPRHIAAQFLSESAILGTLGGIVGGAFGVIAVVTVALAKSWTAVLDPAITLAAPLAGTVVGIAAGLYPGLRAAKIEPVEALRQ